MPAIDFAERIELDQTPRMRRRGKMIPGGILVLHEPLQRMHEPPPQRFAAKERPIVEFGRILRRETGQEVASINLAGLFKRAVVAGALEQMRVDLQLDLRRPSHAGAVGLEDRLAKREFDAMKQAPQSRQPGFAVGVGPQLRGDHVPRNGALGLGEIDQQREPLAQGKLDRAAVGLDLREPERPERESRHGYPSSQQSRGTHRGRSRGSHRVRSSPFASERFRLLHAAPLSQAQ